MHVYDVKTAIELAEQEAEERMREKAVEAFKSECVFRDHRCKPDCDYEYLCSSHRQLCPACRKRQVVTLNSLYLRKCKNDLQGDMIALESWPLKILFQCNNDD